MNYKKRTEKSIELEIYLHMYMYYFDIDKDINYKKSKVIDIDNNGNGLSLEKIYVKLGASQLIYLCKSAILKNKENKIITTAIKKLVMKS